MYNIIIKCILHTLTEMIKATLFAPIFHELNSNIQDFFYEQKAYFSQILFTNLSKSVLVNEIIHPPHRCVISRCWLNSMIIVQVYLRLATIKDHSKMCSFITAQCHRCHKFWGSVPLACWLQEHPPELLPVNWMFIYLPYAVSKGIAENFTVHLTGLTSADHV